MDLFLYLFPREREFARNECFLTLIHNLRDLKDHFNVIKENNT